MPPDKATHLPQRLAQPAAPGAMLKRLTAARRLRLREVASHDPAYLALVRQCPCLKCGLDPAGEAAHLRMQSGAHGKYGGMGAKPADKWALPLCPSCHREQHKVGEREFWSDLGIDPLYACERLYAVRGDLVAMRAMAMTVIGER